MTPTARMVLERTRPLSRPFLSSSNLRRPYSAKKEDSSKPKVLLQKRGDFPYGSREYQLVLKRPNTATITADPPTLLASLRAHRNIIFGAQQFVVGTAAADYKTLDEVCLPLLDAALEDASQQGEQPQAMAALHGLCHYVVDCLQEDTDYHSPVLEQLTPEVLEAVQAIATGIPRKGHRVVGQGTYRDGQAGWEALAEEFIRRELAEEVELYRARGGTLVGIEHLADTNPRYLKSAGGAMARLFFT